MALTDTERLVLDIFSRNLPDLFDTLADYEKFGVASSVLKTSANVLRTLDEDKLVRSVLEWFARKRCDVVDSESHSVEVGGDGIVEIQN